MKSRHLPAQDYKLRAQYISTSINCLYCVCPHARLAWRWESKILRVGEHEAYFQLFKLAKLFVSWLLAMFRDMSPWSSVLESLISQGGVTTMQSAGKWKVVRSWGHVNIRVRINTPMKWVGSMRSMYVRIDGKLWEELNMYRIAHCFSRLQRREN